MSIRFVTIDRESPMLLPPSLQEWLPETHIARFIVQIVERRPWGRAISTAALRVFRVFRGSPTAVLGPSCNALVFGR